MFSGNTVENGESGLFPLLHLRCGCTVDYIEAEPPAYPREESLANDENSRIMDERNGYVQQEGSNVDIPEQYVGDFSDYEPLTLSKEESAALSELNALALETGHEYGRGFIDGIPGDLFTSDEHNRIQIPAALMENSNVRILHSHTNSTPFSTADMSSLLNSNVDMIGVISANGDVYTASVGEGYIVSRQEFEAETAEI